MSKIETNFAGHRRGVAPTTRYPLFAIIAQNIKRELTKNNNETYKTWRI